MGIGAAVLGGAALSGAASLGGGLIQSGAAKSAAAGQQSAATEAAVLQQNQFNSTKESLAPFVSVGQTAAENLSNLTGTNVGGNPLTAPLTAPFQPTMAQLAATPGYQFTLGQGELATQNSFAAQGLGTSGAAVKGAANYAEGLASTTYQQQFQNYLTQNQQIYGMLSGQAGLGETAAAGVGALGQSAASNTGNALTAGAAAGAAGTVGSASAVSNALGGVSSAGSSALLLNALTGNAGLFGGGGGNALTGGNVASGIQDAEDFGGIAL